ncbi:MAG: coproporphyrinogen III oxidase [Fusobacteriota bacterium]
MIKLNFQMRKTSIEEFIRVLIPEAKGDEITLNLKKESNIIKIHAKNLNKSITFKYKNIEKRLKNQIYVMAKTALLKLYEKDYRWGGLKGVRPTKLVRNFLDKGFSFEEIEDMLENLYLVSPVKRKLLLDVIKTELPFLKDNFINIYIGIPYCPSKCAYCSFASYEKRGKPGKYYPEFLENLHLEIESISKLLKEKDIKIGSFYIGGGTPTILDSKELEKLLSKVNSNFDLNECKEFTVEAGRVDTLNKEKLKIIKKYGVDRISLNPQTFKKETLEKVNRNSDFEKFNKIYKIAKKLNFIINMDFIIGLVDENTDDIIKTIRKIYDYNIENITIHNLVLKRASKLYQRGYELEELNYEKIEFEIEKLINKKKMYPYYMYRQKNSFKWGENVGYTKKNYESIFNIQMIEEYQSTIGLGGGAMTKIIKDGRVLRLSNPKDPIVYIDEIQKRLKEKLKKIEEYV